MEEVKIYSVKEFEKMIKHNPDGTKDFHHEGTVYKNIVPVEYKSGFLDGDEPEDVQVEFTYLD